jgi:addiction module HigA family antidote
MKYKSKEDIEIARFLISPPGDTLLETLETRGISQTDLASRMDRPIKTINEIIQGKSAIMPETALQLEKVLGIKAEFWIEREKGYQLELAEIKEAESYFDTREWVKNFPLLQMKKLGWIDYVKNDIIDVHKTILSFFEVSSIKAFEQYYNINLNCVAYRMTAISNKNPYAINAWLQQGKLQASKLEELEYDSVAFKAALIQCKSIMINHTSDIFLKLQEICLSTGVKVVYTPCLPKTRLHGSTRWINNNPVIQLSNQYKRNDIFWFTFFHEAGHILLHGKKDIFVEGNEYTEDGVIKENQANYFAEKYLFSQKDYDLFVSEDIDPNNVEEIRKFAIRINTHPACVVGNLAKNKIVHQAFGWEQKIYEKIEF